MAQPGDVVVINTISIKNSAPAPIIRTAESLGTHKQVADLTSRDLIPSYLRTIGMMCYVVSDNTTYQLKGGITNGDWNVFAVVVNERTDAYTPTLGQTLFNLSDTPEDPNDVKLFANGIKYLVGTDFTVAGNQVTWLDVSFAFDTTDNVEIVYIF